MPRFSFPSRSFSLLNFRNVNNPFAQRRAGIGTSYTQHQSARDTANRRTNCCRRDSASKYSRCCESRRSQPSCTHHTAPAPAMQADFSDPSRSKGAVFCGFADHRRFPPLHPPLDHRFPAKRRGSLSPTTAAAVHRKRWIGSRFQYSLLPKTAPFSPVASLLIRTPPKNLLHRRRSNQKIVHETM